MKKTITLTALAAMTVASQAATLSLTNPGFTDLTSWSEGELTNATDGGYSSALVNTTYSTSNGIYAWSSTAALQARNGNYLQQTILSAEATAESYGEFTVGFVSGWRNNNDGANNLTLRVSIWDVDADSELGHTYYTFPANTPTNEFNVKRTIGTQSVAITYDNSAATSGNDIALRFTLDTSQDTFNVTGWIDDVTLEAVPEPSSAALLGLGGLALILRRRK